MNKVLIILIVGMLHITVVAGQHQRFFQPGEIFPYKASMSFSDGKMRSIPQLKGKPAILDLFGSNCITSFRTLPEFDRLSVLFAGRVHMFGIAIDDTLIRPLYQRFSHRLSLRVPVAFDSLLFKIIDINYVPRFVWLNSAGEIAAVTAAESVTEENIQQFITGRYPPSDFPSKPTAKSKLPVRGNRETDDSVIVSSCFSRYNPALPVLWPANLESFQQRSLLTISGAGLTELFRLAYFGRSWWSAGDSLYGKAWLWPLLLGQNGQADPLLSPSRYEYHLQVPEGQTLQPYLPYYFQADISRFFGYTASIQLMKMPYWALIATDPPDRFISQHHKRVESADVTRIRLKHARIGRICYYLSFYFPPDIPILDDTGITTPVDISIDAAMTDINDLKKGLREAGLDLVRRDKWMQVLVLRKN